MRADVLVVGGGPAGSAAGVVLARGGAKVVICDKARFPRDKPCGDGITPRGVAMMHALGVRETEDFHRVNRVRVSVGPRSVERAWPQARIGLPSYGLVCSRTVLDALLLQAAQNAGATVLEGASVSRPLFKDGFVTGGLVHFANGRDEQVDAPISIAASGATSRFARDAGLVSPRNAVSGIAIRAQTRSLRPDDDVLEVFPRLGPQSRSLPGYGWVFPMGSGAINVGIGYVSTARDWRSLSARDLFDDFLRTLPTEWAVPGLTELRRRGAVAGWKLPMGLTTSPTWRPGVLAAGDAVAAAKPFTGAGISKAMQSAQMAAQVALDALSRGDPRDLAAYDARLRSEWGRYYAVGRSLLRLLGHDGANRAFLRSAMARPARDMTAQLFSHSYASRGGRWPDLVLRTVLGRRHPEREEANPMNCSNAVARQSDGTTV